MEEKKTQEQYNQEYGNLCAQIGDKIIALEGINNEILKIKQKINELAEEARKARESDTVAP